MDSGSVGQEQVQVNGRCLRPGVDLSRLSMTISEPPYICPHSPNYVSIRQTFSVQIFFCTPTFTDKNAFTSIVECPRLSRRR